MQIGDIVVTVRRGETWVIGEPVNAYPPRWKCFRRRAIGAGTVLSRQEFGEADLTLVTSPTFTPGQVVHHNGGEENGARYEILADANGTEARVKVRGAHGSRFIDRAELVLENCM